MTKTTPICTWVRTQMWSRDTPARWSRNGFQTSRYQVRLWISLCWAIVILLCWQGTARCIRILYHCPLFTVNFCLNLAPVYASSEITSCPSTNLIVTAATSSGKMEVYLYLGTKTQELDYMLSPIKALDCSGKYLVTYDESGHLAINGYTVPDPVPVPDDVVKLAVGILIAIIIGGIVLLVILIVLCWCCCCRRRRQIILQANYQKVNEENQPQGNKNGVNVGFSYWARKHDWSIFIWN